MVDNKRVLSDGNGNFNGFNDGDGNGNFNGFNDGDLNGNFNGFNDGDRNGNFNGFNDGDFNGNFNGFNDDDNFDGSYLRSRRNNRFDHDDYHNNNYIYGHNDY